MTAKAIGDLGDKHIDGTALYPDTNITLKQLPSRVRPSPGMFAESGSYLGLMGVASANTLVSAKDQTSSASSLHIGDAPSDSHNIPAVPTTKSWRPPALSGGLRPWPWEEFAASGIISEIISKFPDPKKINSDEVLQFISDACKRASSDRIKKLVLADERIQGKQGILTNLANKLTETFAGEHLTHALGNIFFRFNYITETVDYDPTIKHALLIKFLESPRRYCSPHSDKALLIF
jgi:hypothetical protein